MVAQDLSKSVESVDRGQPVVSSLTAAATPTEEVQRRANDRLWSGGRVMAAMSIAACGRSRSRSSSGTGTSCPAAF